MMENSYKNFRLASLAFYFVLKSDLASKIEVITQLQQFCTTNSTQ